MDFNGCTLGLVLGFLAVRCRLENVEEISAVNHLSLYYNRHRGAKAFNGPIRLISYSQKNLTSWCNVRLKNRINIYFFLQKKHNLANCLRK